MNSLLFPIPPRFFYQDVLILQSIDEHAPTAGNLFELISHKAFQEHLSPFHFKWSSLHTMEEAWESEVHFILAAGGLVWKKDTKELLVIFRRGKWDLPKGKVDKEEEITHAALREVEEETGLVAQLKRDNPFAETYHLYRNTYQQGAFALKKSVWFLMEQAEHSTLSPQKEEGIDEVCWCNAHQWQEKSEHTFPIVNELVRQIFLQSEKEF